MRFQAHQVLPDDPEQLLVQGAREVAAGDVLVAVVVVAVLQAGHDCCALVWVWAAVARMTVCLPNGFNGHCRYIQLRVGRVGGGTVVRNSYYIQNGAGSYGGAGQRGVGGSLITRQVK